MPAHTPAPPSSTPSLHTDRYEFTMLDAARHSGVADHRAVFEVFARSLPAGRRFGVVAGTDRVARAVADFRFDDGELDWLCADGAVTGATRDWLADFRFEGSIRGYPEGELYFPHSPVLTLEGTFAEVVLLETLVLSILNHDTAVASAAARMRLAAGPRTLIDMGGRRTHEEAAIAAARAAWIAGFDATSNLEAGRRYGIPTAGTAAHAFTLAHPDEEQAFRAQLEAQGTGTTLLVDTYDTEVGIRRAVEAARSLGAPGPGGIRIDSGDLREETRRARTLLDGLGAAGTRIVVSGDLDEHGIDALERSAGGRAPIDTYGVGTRLVTGSGAPTAGFVFKLVAVAEAPGREAPLHPVAKRSAGKASVGGRKTAWRRIEGGVAVEEVVHADDGALHVDPAGRPDTAGDEGLRPLQVDLLRHGEPIDATDGQARERCARALAELADDARRVIPGDPAIPTTRPTPIPVGGA